MKYHRVKLNLLLTLKGIRVHISAIVLVLVSYSKLKPNLAKLNQLLL